MPAVATIISPTNDVDLHTPDGRFTIVATPEAQASTFAAGRSAQECGSRKS